jgi:hypothetical protein
MKLRNFIHVFFTSFDEPVRFINHTRLLLKPPDFQIDGYDDTWRF